MNAGDIVGLGVVATIVTAAVFARGLYVLYGAELYYTPALRPLYAFVRAWM
jgi:hypothetical protein